MYNVCTRKGYQLGLHKITIIYSVFVWLVQQPPTDTQNQDSALDILTITLKEPDRIMNNDIIS